MKNVLVVACLVLVWLSASSVAGNPPSQQSPDLPCSTESVLERGGAIIYDEDGDEGDEGEDDEESDDDEEHDGGDDV